MKARSASRVASSAGLLIAAIFLSLQILLGYSSVVEPDSVRMSYGLAHAIRSGEGLGARDLYGRAVSFGYYALFLVMPRGLLSDPARLSLLMNWLSMLSVAGSFVPLVLWMSRLWGPAMAVAAAVLLATSPVLLEIGGYGHPAGPAFLCSNLALAFFLCGFAPRATGGWWSLAAAVVAALAAAILRATSMVLLPLLPLLGIMIARDTALVTRRAANLRIVGGGVLVAVVTIGTFLALQSKVMAIAPERMVPVPGSTLEGAVSAGALLKEHLAPIGARPFLKGVVAWATGLGPLLLVLGGIGVLTAIRRRDWAFSFAAWAVLVPSLILWLPNPTPSRHFHSTFLVLVPAALIWIRVRFGSDRFALVAVLLVVLNIASMAMLRPAIVASYNFAFAKVLPHRVSTRVPLGDPITNRIWVRRRVDLELAYARQLASTAERRVLVFGSPVALRLLYEIVTRSPDYILDYEYRHGAVIVRAVTAVTEYWIYEYVGGESPPPAAVMAGMAAAGECRDCAVAIVPCDRPVSGAAEVPPGYREFAFSTPPAMWQSPPWLPGRQ